MCSQHLSQGKGLPPALHHMSFIPEGFCACSDDHKFLQSLQALPRPIAPGCAGFCSMKVPLLPASQDKHWSSVWREGKDGAGTVTPLAEGLSLKFAVPLICFYLLFVATAAYHYILFPH